MAEGTGYLLFLWSPAGYSLREMEGDPPQVGYEFEDVDELMPAYAISVHKSQGNEYPCVIVPILTQHYVLLQRNLLYTAVTRGKKMVVIVGDKKAIGMAIRNNRLVKRNTRLMERLRNMGDNHYI